MFESVKTRGRETNVGNVVKSCQERMERGIQMNGSSSNKEQQAATCWMALAAGRLTRFQSLSWLMLEDPCFSELLLALLLFHSMPLFVFIDVLCSISSNPRIRLSHQKTFFHFFRIRGLTLNVCSGKKYYSLLVWHFVKMDIRLLFSTIQTQMPLGLADLAGDSSIILVYS